MGFSAAGAVMSFVLIVIQSFLTHEYQDVSSLMSCKNIFYFNFLQCFYFSQNILFFFHLFLKSFFIKYLQTNLF